MVHPQRILLVRIDRIGDLFTSTPLIRALRTAYPDARIDLLASDLNEGVTRNNPDLSAVLIFPLKRFWAWPSMVRRLRGARYDWVVDLNPSYSRSSGCMVRWSGAARRVSLWKERGAFFFTEQVAQTPQEHMIHRQERLARALGAIHWENQMVFCPTESAGKRMGERYPRRAERTRIGFFVGNAKKIHSRWPIEKFAELMTRLRGLPQTDLFVLAGPGDEALLPGLSRVWAENCRLVEGLNLDETGALLQTMNLFITSSSGPMHLAAALRTPTLSILADHTFQCWRPLGDIHRAVRCGGEDVRGIGVEDVFLAARGMMERARGAVPA